MSYHDISLISIYGLQGTLFLQKAGNAEGVSVQTEGPYEVKAVDGSWLRIYPEGQELQIHRACRSDLTAWGTYVGSMDVAARIRFLTDSGSPTRTPTSAGIQAVIRVAAPAGTEFELVNCYGLLKDSRDWHSMRGSARFDIS